MFPDGTQKAKNATDLGSNNVKPMFRYAAQFVN